MALQDILSATVLRAGSEDADQANRRFRDACCRPVTFRALNDRRNEQGVVIQACPSGDPGIYHEMQVSLHTPDGKRIADVLIGLCPETGEARVLVTTDGEGDGDKKAVVYPGRAVSEGAIQEYNG